MSLSNIQSTWTKEQTSYMITLYQEHTCLYDTRDPDFLNKSKKNKILEEIVQQMQDVKPNITVSDVKHKIRTLTSQLSKEKNKILTSKKNGTVYVPTLWCYQELKFLTNCSNEIAGSSNINLNKECDEQKIESENGTQAKKKPRLAADLEDKAMKALDMAEKLAEEHRNMQQHSPEEEFCRFLCSELKKIKNEENFDELKYEILRLTRNMIKKDKDDRPKLSETSPCDINNSTLSFSQIQPVWYSKPIGISSTSLGQSKFSYDQTQSTNSTPPVNSLPSESYPPSSESYPPLNDENYNYKTIILNAPTVHEAYITKEETPEFPS